MAHDILIVDDESDIRTLVAGILEDEGFHTREAGGDDQALMMIETRRPNLVLLDIWLQGSQMDGLQILSSIKKRHPSLPVVMMSGHGTVETAVKAIKDGAYDFIEKPFKADRMVLVVERAIEAARLKRENEELRQRSDTEDDLVGTSSVISQVRQAIERVAPANSRVLVSGPSGSGKEVVARMLHDRSNRANSPFVVMNCASMEPERMEIELFGAESSSEDDEGGRKIGYFEAAHTGTLFLDEVTDMPLETQGKIVRVLQEQIFERVGGTVKIEVDVRVVASATRDIQIEIKEGRFREDLFYRLHVVPIHLPPLRDRGEDVIEIAEGMLKTFAVEENRAFRSLSDEVKELFRRLPWPGNVRQLLNVLRNVVVLNDGAIVLPTMLPLEILHLSENEETAPPHPIAANDTSEPLKGLIGRPLAEIERFVIEETIAQQGGSVQRAARVLDVSPSTIYRKRDAWGA